MKKKYYAYLIEDSKNSGIVEEWENCKKIVNGKKARYKSFLTKDEAKDWLESGAKYSSSKAKVNKINNNIELQNGIYFDAGTGRGIGVEVRVSDKNGKSLLYGTKYTKRLTLNEFGNFELGFTKTNNYGELLGLYIALDIALNNGERQIFGDSHLVIFFWSLGRYHEDKLDKNTVTLIEATINKRKEYENLGGKIFYISGDINPADLGFHK